MKIVDQPLGRGGDGLPRIDSLGDVAVGGQEHGLIVGKPHRQRGALHVAGRHGLRGGKAVRVFFKPLDTKQLGPDGSPVVPWRGRSTYSQPKPQAQRTLEARSAPAREVIDFDKHGLAAPSTWAWPLTTPASTLPWP